MTYEHFVVANVYVLLVLNALLVVAIIIYKALHAWKVKRNSAHIQRWLPRVQAEMEKIMQGNEPDRGFLLARRRRRYVYQTMLKVVKETGKDYHQVFDQLGFTASSINRLKSRGDYTDLGVIKELSLIKSPLATDALYDQIGSHNVEKAYRAAYVLGSMEHDETASKRLIQAVLSTRINRQRMTELIERFEPPLNVLLTCLEEENNEDRRVILLLALKKHKNIKEPGLLTIVQPYLYSCIDVSIAAVEVIAAVGDQEAFELLKSLLETNPAWEVRARIARILPCFPPHEAVPLLKVLSEDEAWWVRYNTMNALGKMGQPGLNTILDLALNSGSRETADLAYQMLNASADVFTTVSNLEEEKTGL